MKRFDVVVVSLTGLAAFAGSAFAQCGGSNEASTKPSHKTSLVAFVNEQADKDIVDTAVAAGSFKTLAAALQAAGLVDTLKSKGPFTVFAPTDEAFAKLPKEVVASLLTPEGKEKLTKILTYHVVSGRVFSDKVASKGWTSGTVNGTELTSKVEGGKVLINNANVTGTDIDSSNGVIHVIDTVLIPK